MTDNYGHLLEKGIAPNRLWITARHPTRDKKYLCGDCGNFVWAFRLADMRLVPPPLRGGNVVLDFACDGCVSTYERNHGAGPVGGVTIPNFKGGRMTQGQDWRAKQRDWRDQVKAAQEAGQ